jgi:hypothetical protein
MIDYRYDSFKNGNDFSDDKEDIVSSHYARSYPISSLVPIMYMAVTCRRNM